MKKITFLYIFIIAIGLFSCENEEVVLPSENENPQATINFEENFGTTINARFLGRVIDEEKQPVQGATIRIGNTVTSTDMFGIFSITDASAYEKFAYITAEKDGYIMGSRALVPSASGVNRVEIMLLEEDVIATVSSGEASTVSLPNGAEVTFQGNFITQNGSAYNGQVAVILKHLSPDSADMSAMMPGMLFAQNASGNPVALETYGMLAVELKGTSGEELQLAEGSVSEISMPVAATAGNPPAMIPLWYFDEEKGYWIEEGEATLEGNTYVGDVSHFTFWNYDYPYPSIYLCILLEDADGNPMANTPIDLYSSLLNTTGTYGYANSNGVECGLVPSGEQLIVTIPNISCDGEPFTTTIGPFTSDTTTTVTVIAQDQNTSTITGSFLTCEGNAVIDGYIQLFTNGSSEIIPVQNGTFQYTITYCGSLSYSLKGVDTANNQITEVTNGTLDGSTTIDVGVLSACTGFADADNDGVFDIFEDLNGDNNLDNDDTDNDGIPNYLDEDDDGDGINTADEDYDGDNDPTNDDTDGDQIPNYLDAQDVTVYDTEVAGEGCDPLQYDLDAIVANHYNNAQLQTDLTYTFYETEADAIANTNAITVSIYEIPLADVLASVVTIYIKGTSTITGQSAIGNIYLYYDYEDSDNDGLTDCEETTGVDNPNTPITPNGTSDPNDPNDPYNTMTLSLESYPVSESVGSVDVIANLNNASSQSVSIDVNTNDGTATSGNDYTGFSGTITIPAGQTSTTITIQIINDTDIEQTENFSITAEIQNSNQPITNTITILDDDDNSGFPQSGTISVCDTDGSGAGDFDLTSMDAYYLNGNSGTVSYHPTQADADANMNPISSPAVFVDNTTIFVRIDSLGLIQISTLTLYVSDFPNAPTGLSMTQCDGNGDGFATFDLSQLNPDIMQTQTDLIISYHISQSEADDAINALPNIYTNTSTMETIFYRVESASGQCYNTGTIDLIVDPGC